MSLLRSIKSIEENNIASANLVSKRRIPALIWILLVAAALRLVWVMYSPVLPVSDFEDYRRLAVSIVEGEGYAYHGQPTAYRPVGYPLFLAGVFWLSGSSEMAAKLAQVLLGVLTVYLTYHLGAQVFQPKTGEIAGWITAGMPSLIVYTSLLASENLALPLFLLSMLAFISFLKTGKYYYAFAAGLFCGLTTLVRTEVLLLPLAWVGYLAIRRYGLSTIARTALALIVSMTLALTPWILRNYFVFGRFVPATSNGGLLLLAAFNEFTGDPEQNVEGLTRFQQEASALQIDEFEISSLAVLKAFKYLQDQPIQLVRLMPVKLFEFLRDDISGISWNFKVTSRDVSPIWSATLKILAQLYYMLVVVLALGTIAYRKSVASYPLYLLILLPILVWLAYFALFIATDRYHLLILPLVVEFSAFTLSEYYQGHRDKPAVFS